MGKLLAIFTLAFAGSVAFAAEESQTNGDLSELLDLAAELDVPMLMARNIIAAPLNEHDYAAIRNIADRHALQVLVTAGDHPEVTVLGSAGLVDVNGIGQLLRVARDNDLKVVVVAHDNTEAQTNGDLSELLDLAAELDVPMLMARNIIAAPLNEHDYAAIRNIADRHALQVLVTAGDHPEVTVLGSAGLVDVNGIGQLLRVARDNDLKVVVGA